MSVQIRNQESGVLERVAGFNDTDSVLSATSRNPIQNRAVYNALAFKIDKAVDDLLNYYDRSQVYTKTEVRELIGAINTLTIEVVATLPIQDISNTTIYFVGPAAGTNNYDEYVYVGNTWVKIGDTEVNLDEYVKGVDLTTILQSYYTKEVLDEKFSAYYYTKSEIATLLDTKQDNLAFDNAPTANSNNPVKSSGIKTALDNLTTIVNGKQATLTFDNTPTASSNNPVKSGGIKTAIDAVSPANAIITKIVNIGDVTFPASGYVSILSYLPTTPSGKSLRSCGIYNYGQGGGAIIVDTRGRYLSGTPNKTYTAVSVEYYYW